MRIYRNYIAVMYGGCTELEGLECALQACRVLVYNLESRNYDPITIKPLYKGPQTTKFLLLVYGLGFAVTVPKLDYYQETISCTNLLYTRIMVT